MRNPNLCGDNSASGALYRRSL